MSSIHTAIESATTRFVAAILEAIQSATLTELLALQANTTAPARRDRPPKVAKTVKAPARKRAKMTWPKCKEPGCKKNAWRRGHGYCGEHAKAHVGRKGTEGGAKSAH
jgi:hypothetical protein